MEETVSRKFKSKAGDVLPEGTAKLADDVADAGKAAEKQIAWEDAGKAADDVSGAGKAADDVATDEKYIKEENKI